MPGTCHYNHDFTSMAPNGLNASVLASLLHQTQTLLKVESSKRSLNVDSPAFTPTPKNAAVQPAKVGISPKTVAAATFTPRGSGKRLKKSYLRKRTDKVSGSVTPAAQSHSKEPSAEFIPQQAFQQAQFQEFVPGQSFLTSPQVCLEVLVSRRQSLKTNSWRRSSPICLSRSLHSTTPF